MNHYIIDSHCHLDLIEKKGIELKQILKIVKKNNVKILQTICKNSNQREIELLINYTKKYDFYLHIYGIHPCNVKDEAKFLWRKLLMFVIK